MEQATTQFSSRLISKIDKRINLLQSTINDAQKRLKVLPEGTIYVTKVKHKNRYRYYYRKHGEKTRGTYLVKEKNKLISELSKKKYYSDLVKYCTKELRILKEIEKIKYENDSIKYAYQKQSDGIKKYISPYDVDDETFKNQWLAEPYEGLRFSEEDTSKFITERGERVRSKSELLIANMLNKYGIPYKYEYPITFTNGRVAYPDFTILLPHRRKVVYWEHLGKMGDVDYITRNVRKLDDYKKIGINLGINLLISYENYGNPIGTSDIITIINSILEMDGCDE